MNLGYKACKPVKKLLPPQRWVIPNCFKFWDMVESGFVCLFVCFSSNFVMQLKWRSSIIWFSQIWLQLDMKLEKKTGSFYILGYILELIIKIWWSGNLFFKKKSGKFWPFFSMENPLSSSKSYFSGQNFAKVHPEKKKRNIGWSMCMLSTNWGFLFEILDREAPTQ